MEKIIKSHEELRKEVDKFGEYVVELEKKHIKNMNKAMHDTENEALKKLDDELKKAQNKLKEDGIVLYENLKSVLYEVRQEVNSLKEYRAGEHIKENFWKVLFKILFKRK